MMENRQGVARRLSLSVIMIQQKYKNNAGKIAKKA
jgi:hypothetical protein